MRRNVHPVFLGLALMSSGASSLISQVARASFDISPITAELSPAGPRASMSYTVQNTSTKKVPLQIYIVARDPDADGKEVYKDTAETEGLFQIYPSQMVLNAKEKRTVRVSWVGAATVKQELAFRMISEELPFDVDDPDKSYTKVTASVKVASKYVGSIYITPAGAAPNLVVKGEPSKDAVPTLLLDVENKGSAHIILRKGKMTIDAIGPKKGQITLSESQVQPVLGNNILAGKTRRIVLPWPRNLPVGPVKVNLEVPKE